MIEHTCREGLTLQRLQGGATQSKKKAGGMASSLILNRGHRGETDPFYDPYQILRRGCRMNSLHTPVMLLINTGGRTKTIISVWLNALSLSYLSCDASGIKSVLMFPLADISNCTQTELLSSSSSATSLLHLP